MAETSPGTGQDLVVHRVPWAQLKGVGTGELEITRTRLVFYRRRRFGGPLPSREWELDRLSNLRLTDDGEAIDFEWLDGDGGKGRLLLGNKDRAQEILDVINSLLEEFRAAEEREREEEATQARLLEETHYRSLIWATLGKVWAISGLLYRVVSALKDGHWQDIDLCLQAMGEEAESLRQRGHIDVVAEVEAIAEQASQREVELVVSRCVATLEALGKALEAESPPAGVGRVPEGMSASPDWSDIPYIFLFSGSFRELLLSLDFGEFGPAEENASKLLHLSPVLRERFDLDVEELLWEMVMALKANDRSLVSKRGDDLNTLVTRAVEENSGGPET
jgi:hypothetical protein